jgi:hypothetical protein
MVRSLMTLFPTVVLSGALPAAARAHLERHGVTVVGPPTGRRGTPDDRPDNRPDVEVVAGDGVPLGGARGTVLLVGPDPSPQVRDLLDADGITVHRADLGRVALGRPVPRTAAPPDLDLLAWTSDLRVDVPAALVLDGDHARAAVRVLRGTDAEGATGPVVVAVAETGDLGRRVVVSADLAHEPAAVELLLDAVLAAALDRPLTPEPAALDPRAGGVDLVSHPAWLRLRTDVGELRELQVKDGSVPDVGVHARARELVAGIVAAVGALTPSLPHDDDYLTAVTKDLARWVDDGFGVPDFLDSLVLFHPERLRVDGLRHLVLFPMYTQNGSTDRRFEAVLLEVRWPDVVAHLEATRFSNAMFVPVRFLDFTAGYDTNSAVLFPETVAVREVPVFTWGAIFADREAARFRRVVRAAAETTRLALPPDAARLLDDQRLAEETFVLWDLVHDRTHMRGDLPFDPFMIKQRMPYFLYSLEELRCDLTAFRHAVALEQDGVPHARYVQYAVLFDRIFRFPVTGTRVRNYDGLGGQLLFAWLHQNHVLDWTDSRLTVDWPRVPAAVIALGERIEQLYWRSIDRPKTAHWLAAYELVSATLTPHPASVWSGGAATLPVDGLPKGLTDAVLPDEFPLSMFYEALARKIGDEVASTAGITGR